MTSWSVLGRDVVFAVWAALSTLVDLSTAVRTWDRGLVVFFALGFCILIVGLKVAHDALPSYAGDLIVERSG